MAFTVSDLSDLFSLLEAHPEWRARLRAAVLSDEVLALPETVARLAAAQEAAVRRFDGLEGRFGNVDGSLLENRYLQHYREWLAPWIRDARRTSPYELDSDLDREDRRLLANADLLLAGTDRAGNEHYAVVEISTTIDPDDVVRADSRAAVLRRAGRSVTAIAGGHRITAEAQAEAERTGVAIDIRRPRR